jgi:hypothetical protein
LKQLISCVVKPGLWQFGCHDAPNQPNRETDVLGGDGPNEISLSDVFARVLPERLVVRIPFRDPPGIRFAHRRFPFA